MKALENNFITHVFSHVIYFFSEREGSGQVFQKGNEKSKGYKKIRISFITVQLSKIRFLVIFVRILFEQSRKLRLRIPGRRWC